MHSPARIYCRTGLAALLILAVTGCTRVTVTGADGRTVSDSGYGIVSINANPGKVPQILSVESFGIVSRNGGVSVGYESTELVALPVNDCRVVLFVRRVPPNGILAQLREAVPGACIVNSSESGEKVK